MRYRQIYVRLSDEELRRLAALAAKERRVPKDQAAVLIVEGLERAEQDAGEVAAPALAAT